MASLATAYNAYSFTNALPLTSSDLSTPSLPSNQPQATTTTTNPPVAGSQGDAWQALVDALSQERRLELLGKARELASATRCAGFSKSRTVAELDTCIAHASQLPSSPTAKFFMLRAAFGDNRFSFRHGNWTYPATPHGDCTRRTVLRSDGTIGFESVCDGPYVPTDNPWRPVGIRGAYKKAELVSLVQRVTGTQVDRGIKADAVHAQLAALVVALEQN
jgi:hypothetical protein